METDSVNIILVALLILLTLFIFIKIAVRLRKHGGSMTTTILGSTYEFLNKDKREAAEEIVEMKANKKLEEESTNKPVE
ncbi:MAG: hypothetical protein P8Y79_14700 [Ignavibacteriaceae bacterium]